MVGGRKIASEGIVGFRVNYFQVWVVSFEVFLGIYLFLKSSSLLLIFLYLDIVQCLSFSRVLRFRVQFVIVYFFYVYIFRKSALVRVGQGLGVFVIFFQCREGRVFLFGDRQGGRERVRLSRVQVFVVLVLGLFGGFF